MTDSPLQSFSRALCPWLHEPYARLERAHRDGRLGHAWLIGGPAGLGKINLALAIAHRILNAQVAEPDRLPALAGGPAMRDRHEPADHHPDLHWIFPAADKRSISVDQIRDLGRALTLTSLRGGNKAVVIEPAEAMTLEAANALLKTLEEPTPATYLFLVSHQPGRLPATIRSRCQRLGVLRPVAADALEWLAEIRSGATRENWALLLMISGAAPFAALQLHEKEYHIKNSELEEQFHLISKNKADPQAIADDWLKQGVELPLRWLAARLQRVIRARMAPELSNPITDLDDDRLHNAWRPLTLGGLFHRLDAAETLLAQLGRGTNVDLALRVLLLDFYPQRERT